MPTVFTKIMTGELPGTFVWRDDLAVGFLSIAPLQPGHALVVPHAEIDHWIDLDVSVTQHLMAVAHFIGKAQFRAFNPVRVGMIIAGLEVPHVHLHVVPIQSEGDLNFANARPSTPDAMEAAAAAIRAELRALGRPEVAD